MFSTTLSMWSGIVFAILAIVAVLLQAWLWGPKFWDEAKKRTKAPKRWLRVHALVGYTYGLIYLFMMWHMVPRLWEYQYELPARTVIHAVVAIVLGVLLITKIVILIWFRHFEEAMPRFGFGILLCTIVLTSLSVPYAVRAHDLAGDASTPENLERVKRLLAEVEFEEEVDLEQLASVRGLERGRSVLVTKCTVCHDMRTILAKPRPAKKWHDVNLRMLDKPAVFGDRMEAEDVPWATAYLVAITPEIQESLKRRRAQQNQDKQLADAVGESVHEADDFQAPIIDDAAAEKLVQARCTECHETDDIDDHGGDDLAGWRSVVAAMVEEGAEVTDEEVAQIAAYLARTRAGGAEAPPPPKEPEPGPEPEPEPEPAAGDGGDEAEPAPKKQPKKRKPRPKKQKPEAEGGDEPPAEQAKPKPPAKPAGDAKAGQVLFLKKCKACHGADGKGQTAYGQKIGVADLANSSLGASGIRKVVSNGKSGTKMRGYKSKLSAEQLDNLVAFVKSL